MRKLIIAFIAIAACVVIIGPLFGTVSPTFSDGDRVGVITKFSHKGVVVKSYEGEMNLGGLRTVTVEDEAGTNVNSVVANVFEFSVTDEAVVSQIKEAMEKGRRVELHYDEYMWKPYNLSTAYVVTSVKILNT
jgi:DhnA family fructose-bisphosphate aldolase class Ia